MDEQPVSNPASSSDEANALYKSGVELKAKGQTDAALTSFRRAVIIDPNFFAALIEIGFLCRVKAKADRVFLRYAFDAFRKAARQDLTHEVAHNQYIMTGQQMGVLDEMVLEYGAWSKKFPDNQLLQRCNKNIVALSMALMPQNVNMGGHGGTSIRKVVLVASVICLLAGIGFVIAPPILLKLGKIKKEQVGGMIRIGLVMGAAGTTGFVIRSKIN